jgi:hypothetical protein
LVLNDQSLKRFIIGIVPKSAVSAWKQIKSLFAPDEILVSPDDTARPDAPSFYNGCHNASYTTCYGVCRWWLDGRFTFRASAITAPLPKQHKSRLREREPGLRCSVRTT